jgi:hypothetical protein
MDAAPLGYRNGSAVLGVSMDAAGLGFRDGSAVLGES